MENRKYALITGVYLWHCFDKLFDILDVWKFIASGQVCKEDGNCHSNEYLAHFNHCLDYHLWMKWQIYIRG